MGEGVCCTQIGLNDRGYQRMLVRKRKQQRRRQRRLVSVLAVIVAAVAVIILCTGFFVKPATDQKTAYTYFTEVRVGRNESLWTIAQRYYTEECGSISEYLEDVKNINSMQDDRIYYGEYLTIPYCGGAQQ